MPRRKRDRDGIFSRDGWFYLQHKGRRVSLKTQNRDEARRNADEYKRKAADPAHQTADLKRLEDACLEFRAHAETGDNRPRPPAAETFVMYDTHFGHFLRIFGPDAVMSDIDAPAVDDYIARRRREPIGKLREGQPDTRKRVSARTVDKELGTLRQILKLGLRRGWYHLPIERVLPDTAGGEYEPLKRHLTLEQVPALFRALAFNPTKNQQRGGFIGVYRTKTPGRWEAKLTYHDEHGRKQQRHLGCYTDQLEAARAYDAAAREHASGARTNFAGDAPAAADDRAGRVATCAYILAFGADWCAVERAERYDLGTAEHCERFVLIRGTKNAKRWAEVPVVHPFQEFAEIAREWLVKHGSFPAWDSSTRDLARACARADLPRITVRDLRRSHGKALRALGVDSDTIGDMLRHTDSRMAKKVYAQPEREDIGRRVAAATRKAS